MRRIALACAASLLIYIGAFACVLDRPLTLDALRTRIEATIALARTIHEPKLVILAGSNGPYSHRCETIGPIASKGTGTGQIYINPYNRLGVSCNVPTETN